MLKGKKILMGVCGGIAAYKVCNLVRLYKKAGADVKIIMTPPAVNFVSPLTLSSLSGNEVVINMFPESLKQQNVEKINSGTWHVHLGLWADVFVIAPVTLNTIGKIISGITDNFLLTTLFSARCPVIMAPAMDSDMYAHPVSQSNLSKLNDLDYIIIPPEEGELASGLEGIGRMAEPETIFEVTEKIIGKSSDLYRKKIVITAGPTLEYIDSVRFLTNASTGKMGFAIAQAAIDRGAEVTLISGPVNLLSKGKVKLVNVKTSGEMYDAVKSNSDEADLIIMTAAVEDLKPVTSFQGKIKKENLDKSFSIEFTKTVDILENLGKSKKNYKLFGFALETENELENAKYKLRKKNLDLIVLNNPNDEGSGFGSDTNKVTLITNDDVVELPLMSKYQVGNAILDKYLTLS